MVNTFTFRYTRRIDLKHYLIPFPIWMILANVVADFWTIYAVITNNFCQMLSSNMWYKIGQRMKQTLLFYIPFLILIILNVLIVKEMTQNKKNFIYDGDKMRGKTDSEKVKTIHQSEEIQRRRKNNVKLAKLSLVIDIFFILSHALNFILVVEAQPAIDQLKPFQSRLVLRSSFLLVVFNSSFNFYLFVWKKLFKC